MGRQLLGLAVVVLAVYLHSEGQTSWAVLCILLVAWATLKSPLRLMLGALQRLTSIAPEHDANSVLVYTFNLGRVFTHPAVDALFTKLQQNQKAPAQTLEEWRTLLGDSYARRYKRDDLVCEVRFNIKANVLYVNGEPDFGDHVYHELEIPYRWTDQGKPQEAPMLTPDIEAQLSVRALVLNGTLLLQVGRFSKDYSPKLLKGGSLAVYETYATLTSFPLMYFSYQHGIPVRYLNLVAQATPSYKVRVADRLGVAKAPKGPGQFDDWRALHGEVAAYRVLCDTDNENHSAKTQAKLAEAFEEKRNKLLTADGYRTYETHDDDWRYPDMGHEYWNQYAKVFFRNLNANRDSFATARWFTDYHEEEP